MHLLAVEFQFCELRRQKKIGSRNVLAVSKNRRSEKSEEHYFSIPFVMPRNKLSLELNFIQITFELGAPHNVGNFNIDMSKIIQLEVSDLC